MPPSVQCQLGRQKPLVLPSKCWNVIDVTFTQTTTLPASRKCTRSSWKPHVLLLNLARDRKKYHRGIPDFHILDYQFKCFHFLLQEQMQHFDWLNLTYHCPELLRKRVRRGALLLPLTPSDVHRRLEVFVPVFNICFNEISYKFRECYTDVEQMLLSSSLPVQ